MSFAFILVAEAVAVANEQTNEFNKRVEEHF